MPGGRNQRLSRFLFSEAKAASRVRQPSSSRTLEETLCATYSATSGASCRFSKAAFFCILRPGFQDPGARYRQSALIQTGSSSDLQTREYRVEPFRREDDLMAVGVQRIERVKELFLGAFATGQELDVVEDERVDASGISP